MLVVLKKSKTQNVLEYAKLDKKGAHYELHAVIAVETGSRKPVAVCNDGGYWLVFGDTQPVLWSALTSPWLFFYHRSI